MLKPLQNLFLIVLAGAISLGVVATKAYDLHAENSRLRQELEEIKQLNNQLRLNEVKLKATVIQLQMDRQAQVDAINQLGQAAAQAADRELDLQGQIAALEAEVKQLRSLLKTSSGWVRAIERVARWVQAVWPWHLGFGVVMMGSAVVEGPIDRIEGSAPTTGK